MKKYLFIFSLSVFLIVFILAIKVFAVDQTKTAEFFVISSDSQISSATSSQFTVYIGDNLSGVANPVKSVYFTASGVYTGNGTIKFEIDSDAATAKTFTLPNVGTAPTPFEIIYKDDTNKINPISAGSYSYAFNITPSGVTISGLAAKANITHRFAPPSCPDGQSSNEKIKTTEHFVISSDSQISSATSSQFTVYIGDNLSGVANPVKSVYFTASGVYTGNGTIKFEIDSDAATAKTFTLPNVGTAPTPFEIIYKDDTNKINPISAGSYSYAFNITPSGVTISGLAAKATISHRYKPPTCGGGYPATGDLTSAVFDTGAEGAAYNSVMWKGNLGTGNTGKVRFQLAVSDIPDPGTWTYVGSDGTSCGISFWYDLPSHDTPKELKCFSDFNNKRYFRYKVQICSTDCSVGGSYTPQVDDVVVSWSP